jgi:hypothetical protein
MPRQRSAWGCMRQKWFYVNPHKGVCTLSHITQLTRTVFPTGRATAYVCIAKITLESRELHYLVIQYNGLTAAKYRW